MTTKYYQIEQPDSECSSVGVIKIQGSEIPYDKIKSAIQSHLDSEIEILLIEGLEDYGDLRIHFRREDGEKDTFLGVETWLYF